MHAAVSGHGFGPKQEQAGHEHQEKAHDRNRHDLPPYFRDGLISHRKAHQAKIEPAEHSDGERDSEQVSSFDDREHPKGFTNSGTDLAVVNPLAEIGNDVLFRL